MKIVTYSVLGVVLSILKYLTYLILTKHLYLKKRKHWDVNSVGQDHINAGWKTLGFTSIYIKCWNNLEQYDLLDGKQSAA